MFISVQNYKNFIQLSDSSPGIEKNKITGLGQRLGLWTARMVGRSIWRRSSTEGRLDCCCKSGVAVWNSFKTMQWPHRIRPIASDVASSVVSVTRVHCEKNDCTTTTPVWGRRRLMWAEKPCIRWSISSPTGKGTFKGWQCGLLPNYFGHLFCIVYILILVAHTELEL